MARVAATTAATTRATTSQSGAPMTAWSAAPATANAAAPAATLGIGPARRSVHAYATQNAAIAASPSSDPTAATDANAGP